MVLVAAAIACMTCATSSCTPWNVPLDRSSSALAPGIWVSGRTQVTWSTLGVCQTMLANPTSTAQSDVDRRARVLQRIRDYNAALADVCALYRQCLYDGNAAFDAQFTKADVGHFDYFHPSLTGQASFAAGTWAVSYWGN